MQSRRKKEINNPESINIESLNIVPIMELVETRHEAQYQFLNNVSEESNLKLKLKIIGYRGTLEGL